ncbi:MAG: hypothetical protein PVI86_06300 [Phycisphaerae bacterium]|jgi:hypothetical protein
MSRSEAFGWRRCLGTASAVAALIIVGLFVAAPQKATADRAIESDRARSEKDNTSTRTTTRTGSTSADDFVVRPACTADCQFVDVDGNSYESPPPPSVASPYGTTYSVHHWVGVDLNGDERTECFPTAADPPPGPPDDIVLFDGTPEQIRMDVFGTIPTVVETSTSNGDGTHTLIIDTQSPPDVTELFPLGLTDPGSGTPLVDACYLLGIDDPLNWPGVDTVTEATITFLDEDIPLIGPMDISDPAYFSDPWDGRVGVTLVDGAGLGINRVRLEIRVGKIPSENMRACCVDGVCLADVEETSCANLGGVWQLDASCGGDPNLPGPVCERTTCGFDNGLPLDDGGTPPSQYAPDEAVVSAAVDDFVLPGAGNDSCIINNVRAWVTHETGAGPPVEPLVDYQGVNVTIYADLEAKKPAGHPSVDGSHTPSIEAGILYSQTVPNAEIQAAEEASSCLTDLWRLDIPIEVALNEDTKYWIEVQPLLDLSIGQARMVLSRNNNGNPAQQVFSSVIPDWQSILGNADDCPEGVPATPPLRTRKNLAFVLSGQPLGTPPNDDCEDFIEVTDGFVAFSNVGSSTDGDDEPEACDFFDYTHIESDIWYQYTATCTGDLSVRLCDSEYDTKLAVYGDCRNCPPRTGSVLACSEDACQGSVQSEVELPVRDGICYGIRIGGFYGDVGTGLMEIECTPETPNAGACCENGICLGTMTELDCLVLDGEWFGGETCATINCPIPIPENDECADCIPVSTNVAHEATSLGASGTDISSCANEDTVDVWHCWTADCSGVATISLCGSAFDTTLAVYDGCGGNELACADDDCGFQSELELLVTEGETYYIRVSGFEGAEGNYSLLVTSCLSACCFPQGVCALGTAQECASVNGDYIEGWDCATDEDNNNVPDACELPPPWFFKDYNGDEPDGLLPDYDQNNDYDNADGDGDPTTGVDAFYCGPTAVANSLWWFDHRYPDAGVVAPAVSHAELIEDLATRMGTNGTPSHPSPNGHVGPYTGTFPDDLHAGINSYLIERGVTDLFYQHTVVDPTYDFVVDELIRSQDVILQLGFYHIENVDPVVDDYVVAWRRTGGHYVTAAGVLPEEGLIAISDPDADAAEEMGTDFVRGGDHDHDGDGNPGTLPVFRDPNYDHTVHGDKNLASHDIYAAGRFEPATDRWVLTVDGDPLAYGDMMASFHDEDAGGAFDVNSTFWTAAFLQETGYPAPEVCQTYAVVEAAIIVSPFGNRLIGSAPAHEQSLWRIEENLVRLGFENDIAWPFDGTFQIRELLEGGAFGPDLSGQFIFEVESDGGGDPRILKIREDGAVLSHRTWVAFSYAGGGDIVPFELHFPVQFGDASADGRVLAFDVSVINTGIRTFTAPDDERRDIDGDGRILPFDVTLVEPHVPSFPVPKPGGH